MFCSIWMGSEDFPHVMHPASNFHMSEFWMVLMREPGKRGILCLRVKDLFILRAYNVLIKHIDDDQGIHA
jgi:hypothetical protein